MTYRFPEIPQNVNTAETEITNCIDNLIACANKGTDPGMLHYPHGVAIHPATNHIHVAEGNLWNYFPRVSVFSESGEFLHSFTHESMRALCGIAIHGDSVYLSDIKLHAVFQMKIDGDFRLEARLGSKGAALGQFDDPRQISTSNNGDVYVADYGNDRIQILDHSLRPLTEVTHSSLHRPCDVKLTTDEMYVLSPIDTPCLHVFSRIDNRKLRSLIASGIGEQVCTPYYFCFIANKGLAISDWGFHQIKLFTNAGVLLHSLGEWGHELEMFSVPNGLALTSHLRLVTVSCNETCGLQIFSFL